MRHIIIFLAPLLLVGCDGKSAGDNVREAYENKAAAVESQVDTQPTEASKQIYQSHADAIREEGKDRETGLEGGEPSAGQGQGSTTSGK